MSLLHPLYPLSDFVNSNNVAELSPTYWYEGRCAQSGQWLRLPRTTLAEAIARGLMQELAIYNCYNQEGKMYGVLIVETPVGQRVLKAFSGLLNGKGVVEGWVPPISGREQVALEEAYTLAALDEIKQELLWLQHIPERQQYESLFQSFEIRLQELAARHLQRKSDRQRQRQLLSKTLSGDILANALDQLDNQSRQDGIERRRLKQERHTALQPFQKIIEQADTKIQALKRQRKILSRQLQSQMHAAYSLTNFRGESLSLQQLVSGDSMPTGTGDCCAPKLLHYAATHHLKPLAMAEFWWGSASTHDGKVEGEFYGACHDRCQPLMGFLLSGISQKALNISTHRIEEVLLPIVYEDDWLIAVNKPSGLLSVPGRYSDRQDSVLSRLRHLLPNSATLMAVHRLDQETSGILLLARHHQSYRQLSQQFQQRQVYKIYEALLAGIVTQEQGLIDLPLWGDPRDRPRQKINEQFGKPSVTRFRVILREENNTRIEFIPITGRTHQLRVHAADSRGLGVTILGDRLYGCQADTNRLHLHARELKFMHPESGETIHLQTATPF